MCKYTQEYFDFEAHKLVLFQCKEKAVQDGLCVFHHPEYWKKHPKEVANKLYEKIEAVVNNKAKLLCIGYNLSQLTLRKVFPKSVYFSHSTFYETADFNGATFGKGVSFSGASFRGEANFVGATFGKRVSFSGTSFRGEANFFWASFRGEADFNEATFGNIVSFSGASFRGEADFNGASFRGEANFVGATFSGEVYLIQLGRITPDNQERHDPTLFFSDVTTQTAERVHFDNFDISNVSFAYTDKLSQIDLGESVRWKADKKLLDELLADDGKIPYETAATVFRRLQQNLESKLRYPEAGRFFIAEMNVRRKNVKVKNRILRWFRINVFSILAWYRNFSNYGENYTRIIFPWIVGTLVIPPIVMTLATTPLSCSSQLYTNFQTHLHDFTFAFFQLKTDSLFELVIRILSLLFLGQLYMALRRRFERKFKTTPR